MVFHSLKTGISLSKEWNFNLLKGVEERSLLIKSEKFRLLRIES